MPAGESVAVDGGRITASRPATTTHHRIHIGATGTHIARTAPQIQFGEQSEEEDKQATDQSTAPNHNSAPPPAAAAAERKKTKQSSRNQLPWRKEASLSLYPTQTRPIAIQISNDATADAARKRGGGGGSRDASVREEDGGGG